MKMVEVFGVDLPLGPFCLALVAVGTTTVLVVLARIKIKGQRCTSKTDLTGKTVIVTGANTGKLCTDPLAACCC